MDPTGCPPGIVTDRAFLKDNPLCDVEIALYWGATLSVCTLRLIGLTGKVQNHIRAVGYTFGRRRMVSIIVSVMSTFFYTLTAVLMGVNVANADNGWSFSLYSMVYLMFIIDFTMMLFKIVRLGRRVIALPREELGSTEDDYLAKFTKKGVVLAFLQIIMAVTSCVVLTIMSPIFPDQELLLGTLGFATKGIFQILCTLGIVLQLQRCVRAIDRLIQAETTKNAPTSETEAGLRRVMVARTLLRQRQVFVTIFGGSVGLLILLLSFAIPWHWGWVTMATAGPEAFGHILVEFMLNRRRSSTKSSSSRDQNFKVEDRPISSKRSAEITTEEEEPPPKMLGLRIKKRKKQRKAWKLDLSKIAEETKVSSAVSVRQ